MFKTILISSLVTLGSYAQVANKTKAMRAVDNPLNTCNAFIDRLLNKDFNAVQKLSLETKMHKNHLAELTDVKCLREMIAKNRAIVEAESESGKRLVPFVKTEMGWKFDTATYMAFYNHKHSKTKK